MMLKLPNEFSNLKKQDIKCFNICIRQICADSAFVVRQRRKFDNDETMMLLTYISCMTFRFRS